MWNENFKSVHNYYSILGCLFLLNSMWNDIYLSVKYKK